MRRIELSAPNHKSYAKSVSLRATERRTLDVALGAVASTPAPAVPATVAAAVPARSVAVVPPPRRVAVTAAPRGDAPKGAGAEPKVTAPRPIPTLKLPVSVRVNLYTEDGKRARFAGMVLFAVENVVTRSLGLSAAGSTGPLLRYLYSQPKDEDAKVKLYPRTMGYFVAHALSREEKGVGARLLQAYRSGRIEKLAQRSWRP